MNPTLHVAYVINFYPRDDMLARYRIGPTPSLFDDICLCLSVCLSSVQGCARDLFGRDRDETETETLQVAETLPRRLVKSSKQSPVV